MPTALVVTSIHSPTAAMRELATGCQQHRWDFVVAGDRKSPADFSLHGCRFLSLETQRDSGFSLGRLCPERSYTRKNVGYLSAIQAGAKIIVETDDDNHPRSEFWRTRQPRLQARPVAADGWVNAYRYFSREFIYPRGLPLCHARDEVPVAGQFELLDCPVQQGLADTDPDVDAVYRMLFPLPFEFETDGGPILLGRGAWCPFNSQNTTFFESAFPLLYLPAWCSFRMTDIWRSFVAQRLLQARGLGVLFHGPTLWQERNDHNLQQDFVDELPGYTNNARIRDALNELSFAATASTRLMMEQSYQTLIRHGWVGPAEERLLEAWLDDLGSIATSR